MFTYFCNKFRPLYCMQYIKCSVNLFLHNSGCCRGSVTTWVVLQSPHNAHTHASCNETTLQICFCVIIGETRHHAQIHITFGTFVYSGLSLAPLRTNAGADIAFVFCWQMLVMAAVQPHNICCSCTWPSNHTVGGALMASSIFLDQIPQQK
jgi:hypothetical protein